MSKMAPVVLSFVFFLLGCGEDPTDREVVAEPEFPAIENSSLLVIHHDRAGELIHYLVLEKLADDMLIEIEPARVDQDLYVTVLGRKRHDLLKRSFSISSQVGDGYLGKIEVIVENGEAISLNGNRMHSPGLVSKETLQIIADKLADGSKVSAGKTTISIVERKSQP